MSQCHSMTLCRADLESTEAFIQNEGLSGHIRHLRIVAQCFAIKSAESILGHRKYFAVESAVDNGQGDVFTAEMPSEVPGTDEQLTETASHLEWMRQEQAAEETGLDLNSENSLVNRLSSILSWGGRESLSVLELDARFVDGPGQFSSPGSHHIDHHDRQRLYARASHLYRIVMTALARSGVAISDLRIFSSTTGLSVPSYDITVALPAKVAAGIAVPLASVKHLSLSFSTRVDHGFDRLDMVHGPGAADVERRRTRKYFEELKHEPDWWSLDGLTLDDSHPAREYDLDGPECDPKAEADAFIAEAPMSDVPGRHLDYLPWAACQDNFTGIARLLGIMSQLETLDLHMFQTLEYSEHSWVSASTLWLQKRIFRFIIAEDVKLPHLKHLILRGVCIESGDLIAFLERHRHIETLELHHVMLANRTQPGDPAWKEVHDQVAKIPEFRTPKWRDVIQEICRRTVRSRQGSSLSRIFCSDLCRVPISLAASTHPDNYLSENLISWDQKLKREWVMRWWCGPPRGAGRPPVLYTREFKREELEQEWPFLATENGLTVDELDEECRLQAVRYPVAEMDELRKATYGRTYGATS